MSKQSEKTNPRRIPRTEVDCQRAHTQGMLDGNEFCINLTLWVLSDRWQLSHEKIRDFIDGYEEYTRLIREDIVKYREIRDCLKKEYDLELLLRPGYRDRQDQPLNGMNEGRGEHAD